MTTKSYWRLIVWRPRLYLGVRQEVGTTSPLQIQSGTAPGYGGAGISWLILIVAGLLEAVWAVGLKSSAGFTKPWVVALTVVALVASVGLLGVAMRELPVGAAYAVWTGIGAVGTVLVGIVCFGEPATIGRLISVSLILAGMVGLKLASHV